MAPWSYADRVAALMRQVSQPETRTRMERLQTDTTPYLVLIAGVIDTRTV
jgi:hypothetical protein